MKFVYMTIPVLTIFALSYGVWERERLNVYYLCYQFSRAEHLPEVKAAESSTERKLLVAEFISDSIYTSGLKNVFGVLGLVSPGQRRQLIDDAFNELAGPNYSCPALDAFFK
jgi:hypothetical protein